MDKAFSSAAMLDELIRLGHIVTIDQKEELVFPGAHNFVPTILSYGTPNIPIRQPEHKNAKLEQRS
jgi:hypothetical protein